MSNKNYLEYQLSLYDIEGLKLLFKENKVVAYGNGSFYLKVKEFIDEFGFEFDDILYTENSKIISHSGRDYEEISKDSSILICSSFYEQIIELIRKQEHIPKNIKIANFLNQINYFERKLIYLNDSKYNSLKIKDYEKNYIFLPNFINEKKEIEIISPRVYIYKLTNIFGKIDSSSFYDTENIILDNLENVDIKFCNYSSGNLKSHDNEKGLLNENNFVINIPASTLFLGGNGSFNYFHWLIEILFKLFIIDKNILLFLGIKKIIVSSDVKKYRSFQDSLNIILKYKKIDLPIEYISRETTLKFEKVFYINNLNHVLFNSKIKLSDPNYYRFSKIELNKYRDIFLSYSKKICSTPEKIFLLRKRESLGAHNKREYNELEIFSFFKEKGFTGIFIEDYDFREQIYIFRKAKFIVGPSGAFWTNIIFSSKGANALSWLPANIKDFSVYSTLAKYFAINKYFIETEQNNNLNEIHQSYTVDKNKIIEVFNKITGVKIV